MEVTLDKLTKIVKSDKEISQNGAAQKLGVSLGQVNMLLFCQAKVAAGATTKHPATAASVKKLRDSEGNRWELIAARTGLSVGKVRELYGGEERARASTTGRGRPSSGSSTKRTSAKSGSASSRKGGSTKKSSAAASRKSGATAKRGGIVRNTRSRRSSGNPS